MFWNKGLRISLKLRLVFVYTLLFIVSCSLIFAVASYRIYLEINRMSDEEAHRIAMNIHEAWSSSQQQNFSASADDAGRRNYPESDRKVLEKNFPGMELLSARSEESSFVFSGGIQRKYFTAYIFHKGRYYECRVRQDGSLYSKRVKESSHLETLRRQLRAPADPLRILRVRFSDAVRARGHNDFLIMIWDHAKQKPLLRSGAVLKDPQQIIAAPEYPADTPFEIGKFRFVKHEIPELGTLITGISIENRNRLINQCMVIFFGVLFSVTGVGVAVAWVVARRFINGIKQTTLAMKSISAGDYSYRISKIPYNDHEIVTLMETFNDMNERTEKLLTEIKMMSDNVAHDLRTPLTRISGTVELLLSERDLGENVRNVCVSVLEETLRLKALVNTVMDISRTTSNPDSLNREEVDIVSVISHFADFMQPGFEEKNLHLTLSLPKEKIMVNMDKTMFQRMLANLVENALKFTASGGVDISLKKSGNSFCLCIKDSGCGISAKDLPHIFDRFYRADASRHLSGNGLGLALVKAVVAAHKWDLEVDSVPGEGTSFVIIIPQK